MAAIPSRLVPWGLALGSLGATAPSLAQVMVTPPTIELAAKQRTTSVAISLAPNAAAPLRLQAGVLRWSQDADGKSTVVETDELLVTPPIADLRPGETQVFRVALRGPRAAPEELAYRLILEDVAEPPKDESGAPAVKLSFRMRYDLPVMVAPTGKVFSSLRWKPCLPAAAARAAQACVRVQNAGNRRVKVQTLTLAGDGWQQALEIKNGENVLVGTEREWHVPLAAGQTGALRGVQVQTTRGETLQAESGGF